MEFNLKKNAYNFVNESLRCAKRAESSPEIYPFAILNLIQGLELLLKQLLVNENEILVFDDIDMPNIKKTVSINKAMVRLENFGKIVIEESDKIRLKRTIEFRNQITHFKFKLDNYQSRELYIRSFEFMHYFHNKYFTEDLHDNIGKESWEFEAEVLAEFKRSEFVHYHGDLVHKAHPRSIIEFQNYNGIEIDDETFFRIRFGDETTFIISRGERCGDCGVKRGFFHTDFCDNEQCPKCGEQLIGFHSCDVQAHLIIDEEEE